jgi:hypothetical protein
MDIIVSWQNRLTDADGTHRITTHSFRYAEERVAAAYVMFRVLQATKKIAFNAIVMNADNGVIMAQWK